MSAPHPVDIADHGRPGEPDWGYLKNQGPVNGNFQDAYIHADDSGIDMRIGADPEDQVVRREDGQLQTLAAAKRYNGSDHYDEPTGNFRNEQGHTTEAMSSQLAPGAVALHGMNVQHPSKVYRSGLLHGYSAPRAYASHRADH